jgi:3-oxoacyl-[acyl-carrier-protein] synthase III
MYHGQIIETGSYLPKAVVTNEDMSEIVETSDDWIYSRTGIKERRIAIEESVSDMATYAALDSLRRSNIDSMDIDMIVVATVSADYAMPSTACIVQKNIKAVNAFCFDLQAACSGFVYGLEVIEQFIQTGKVKKALLIGVEKLSQLLNWDDRGTCVLFGDGAGAVIIEATTEKSGIIDTKSKSIGDQFDALVSPLRHNDTPFYKQTKEPYLTMDGRAVFQFACTKVSELLLERFEHCNMTSDEIDIYVFHQANSRILESIAKRLKQPIEKFYMNMERFGNTSAATIPLALDELNKQGQLKGKKIAMAGFGAGLTYASAFVEFK